MMMPHQRNNAFVNCIFLMAVWGMVIEISKQSNQRFFRVPGGISLCAEQKGGRNELGNMLEIVQLVLEIH